MRSYDLYGLRIATNRPFQAPVPLGASHAAPDLVVEWVGGLGPASLVERVAIPEPPDPPALVLSGADGVWRLHVSGAADFELLPKRIRVAPIDDGTRAEIQLLGIVLALWLELAGVPVLHAAAVTAGDRAVAVAGFNGSRKTSIALQLMRHGAQLLADDVLALRLDGSGVLAARGYPQIRLWPDHARRIVGRTEHLAPAHPDFSKLRVPLDGSGLGSFSAAPASLHGVFVLEPTAGAAVSMTTVGLAEAVVELARHSFAAAFLSGLGSQHTRMEQLAAIVARVPVRRVVYDPDGTSLDGVVREVRGSLEAAPILTSDEG